ANSMAALALVQSQLIDVFDAKILQALKAFAGLDHRCQWVACKQGVEYYNDSKGTNVGSTLAAVLGLGATISGKIWLLAGGDGKGQDFSLLPEPCQPYLAKTLLFGRDAK